MLRNQRSRDDHDTRALARYRACKGFQQWGHLSFDFDRYKRQAILPSQGEFAFQAVSLRYPN
jgi:hypothetical protein